MTNNKNREIIQNDVAFRSEIRASGAGEKWSHLDDSNVKFQQFGWRCTNDENAYSEDVLIGNWNEKQFDIKRMVTLSKVPSSYNHYYETTYSKAYLPKSAIQLGSEKIDLLKKIEGTKKQISHTFPAHQPELDTSHDEMITTSQLAYGKVSKN